MGFEQVEQPPFMSFYSIISVLLGGREKCLMTAYVAVAAAARAVALRVVAGSAAAHIDECCVVGKGRSVS